MASDSSVKLIYVTDEEPGYTRRRCGKGFTFLGLDGKTLKDPAERERIDRIVIPPAWQNVWVCALPHGHLQATGRDDRQRKVYRYHDHYRLVQDELKFGRMAVFGAALPAVRRRVEKDLRRRSLNWDKVVAVALELMQSSLLRVGNESYATSNQTFGLTTLRNRHVEVTTRRINLHFVGKSGKEHEVSVEDRRLAKAAKTLSELPGQRLFQYVGEDGRVHPVGSGDINEYLAETTGLDLSAKDFRTWNGTVLAAEALHELGPAESEKQADKNYVAAVKATAKALGNTPTVCRQFYIHPLVPDLYRRGTLIEKLDAAKNPLGRVERRLLKRREAQVLSLLLTETPHHAPPGSP